MSIFVIADTHLSLRVPKPMDIFGSRWNSWTEKLCENWKNTVWENDTVVIPGDISWGMTMEEAEDDLKLLDTLPGKKIIGRGNHDYWWGTMSKIEKFFSEVGVTSIKVLHNNAFECEDNIICGSRGWYVDEKNAPKDADYDKIVAREAARLEISLKAANAIDENKRKLAFFHFPPFFEPFTCREIIDVLHKYGVKDCYYGHIHGKYNGPQSTELEGITFTLISADYLDFTPHKIL